MTQDTSRTHLAAAEAAVADVLDGWVRSIRAFRRSGVYPVASTVDGAGLDRISYQTVRELIQGGPRRLSELAQATGMTVSYASRVVDGLVGKGLVDRVVADGDRRAVNVSATQAGVALSRDVESQLHSLIGARLSDFSLEEMQTFGALFSRFADEVSAWSDEMRAEARS